MSEEFHFLLSQSLSGEISGEERQQVTYQLLEIYKSPQSTLDILQFLLSEKNKLIRHAAAIGLKASLLNNWETISQSEYCEPVKDALIEIYQNEREKTIRHTIVRASTPIFVSDANEWTKLFGLVTELTNNKSNLYEIEFSIYLISYFAPYLSEAMVEANLQFFLDLCEFSFATQNFELIDTACGLVAVLINKIDTNEEMQMMGPAFTNMLNMYSISLTNNNAYATLISNKVAFSFVRSEYPIPNDEILTRLFEVVPANPIIAYAPIIDFINSCGKNITDSFEVIIQQSLSLASSLLVDGSLDDNSDSMFVLLAIEGIAQAMKPRIFFPKLLEILSTETEEDTIISAMTISQVIQASKEAVPKNITQLSKYIFSALQIDHICAKDVALDIIKEIATLFEEGKSDISSQFMEPIIELLDCDQPELIKHALSTLKKLLKCTDIDTNLIGPTLQILSKLLESEGILTAHVFDVISALVFSAGDDVAPFVEDLYPLVIQTASISEEDDPILKANSIEALSNILRFSNLSDDLINQAIPIIIESGQTNDFDIRGSVMSSLSNLLTTKMPQLLSFAEQIQELISAYISDEIVSDKDETQLIEDIELDGDDIDDKNREFEKYVGSQNQINSLTNTLLLIKNIYKLYPQLAPEDPTPWFGFSVDCMESISDDLTVAASLASLYMLLRVSESLDPSGFLDKLGQNFEGSATVASCSFKIISRFMENDFPLPEEVVEFTIEKGKCGLKGELDCQDEDEERDENSRLTLSMQMNKFFAVLATKIPAAFPVNLYIDYETQVFKNSSEFSEDSENSDEFEVSQCIGVLRQLYINSGGESQITLDKLQKKFIIRAFLTALEICDFTVIPEPLIALKNVLEREPDRISQNLQDILGFIENLFESDNEGQMHFWSTMTNAASFLCTLMKMSLESFDLQNWLPRILSVLPVKGDEMEAENIYSTLLWLVTSTPVGPEVIKSLGSELIRVFAQTLGLKEKVLDSFNLTPETAQNIARCLAALLNEVQDSSSVIEQSFSDGASLGRCQERLQMIQQQ